MQTSCRQFTRQYLLFHHEQNSCLLYIGPAKIHQWQSTVENMDIGITKISKFCLFMDANMQTQVHRPKASLYSNTSGSNLLWHTNKCGSKKHKSILLRLWTTLLVERFAIKTHVDAPHYLKQQQKTPCYLLRLYKR